VNDARLVWECTQSALQSLQKMGTLGESAGIVGDLDMEQHVDARSKKRLERSLSPLLVVPVLLEAGVFGRK
jgi:hypothetical protein